VAKKVEAIPGGYHTVTPHLVVRGAERALDFYRRAFGAEETARLPAPEGKIMHAEIRIGDSPVMLSDEFPQMPGSRSPEALGGTTGGLTIYTTDVDQAFKRALDAGAKAAMPPQDMFWGDRYARVVDPFGHTWGIATHIEDVTPAEMLERSRTAFPSE
jgi:PhnB protein